MKQFHAILSFILLVFPLGLLGQASGEVKAVVSSTKLNVLYADIENPLHIAVPDKPCENIRVEISQGSIEGEGCSYLCVPEKSGIAQIRISIISGDTVQSFDKINYRVHPVPDPIPYFGRYDSYSTSDDSVLLRVAKALPGISVYGPLGFPFDISYSVLGFKMQVLRNGEMMAHYESDDSQLTNEMRVFINSELREGDTLIFNEIQVHCQDNTIRKTQPLRFIVY